MIRLGLWVRFGELLGFESNFEKQGEPGDRVAERSVSREHGDLLLATVYV